MAHRYTEIVEKLTKKRHQLIKQGVSTDAIDEVIAALYEAMLNEVNHAAQISQYLAELYRMNDKVFILQSRIVDLENEIKTTEL